MATLCLNMIVKNEAANIERLLASVADHIHAYVILDTGSTDDTIERIERFFAARAAAGKPVPGRVHRGTFVNFEVSRNEALELARSSPLAFDYLMPCDADMQLVVNRPGFAAELKEPAYSVTLRHGGTLEYPQVRLFTRDLPARYVGVTHEYLDVGATPRPLFDGIVWLEHGTGGTRPEKFKRDIALLTEGLAKEPTNARYAFYLASSHYDAGEPEKAIPLYKRRIELGGWPEEVFYSHYRLGLCHQRLGQEAEMIRQLLLTYDLFPHRAEPLHVLALHYQRLSRHRLAMVFAELGALLPHPHGALFVEPEVYQWRLLDIVAVSLWYLGEKSKALAINRRILPIVPASDRPRIEQNIAWCAQGP